jgi:Putative peptidoglycan binding domain
MLTFVRVLTVLLISAGLLLGQTAKKTTAKPVAKPAAKAVATRSVAKPVAKPLAKSYTRVAASRYRVPVRRAAYVAPRPVVVQQPAPERIREIQQALVDKGYLRAEPTGAWDADSLAALNRFKQEQNLRADGKLDARTLIGLGLGPKTDSYISMQPAEQAVGSQERQ